MTPNSDRDDAAPANDRLPALLADLADDRVGASGRARLVGRLTAALGGSARTAGAAAVASGRWLTDTVVELAPRVPVRDLATLRRHHAGLDGDALADALVATAARATAGIGALAGAVGAVEFASPPALLTAPIQLSVELLAVVAIELKLLAELHEVYGARPASGSAERAAAYLLAWSHQRGALPRMAGEGMAGVLGAAARRELRHRLLRRLGRSTSTLAPFLAGAVAGAQLNRRATQRLAAAVLTDLRRR